MRIIIESDNDEAGTTGTAELPVPRAAAAVSGIDAGPPPADLLAAIETASPIGTGGEATDAGPPIEE